MKLDGDSIKQFFLANGEKVVLGIVGLVALLMIAFAFIGKESVGANDSADKIKTRATDAKEKLARQTEVREPKPAPPPPPIKPEYFKQPTAKREWTEPLIPLKRVRREPEFVAAQDIRVRVVRGHVGIKGGRAPAEDAGTADDVKGFKGAKKAAAFRVAVVTGLAPLGLQRSRYDDAFLDTTFPESYTGDKDKPEYYRCILERADVKPGVAEDQLTWTAVNEADNDQTTEDVRDPALKAEMDKWAGVIQPDVVNPSLVEAPLVYPNARPMAADADAAATPEGEAEVDQWLPPRLLVDWEREAIVHPTIIAAEDGVRAKPAETKPGEAKPAAKEAAEEGDDTEQVKKFAASYPHRLLRCYDFSIQPGKKYKYRVVLVLRNPNRGFDDRYLESPKLKEGKFRTAAASKPSAVVTSPGDVQVLAGVGVPVGPRQREPGVKLLLSVAADTQEAVGRAKDKAATAGGPKKVREQLKEEAEALAVAWANVDQVWATAQQVATRGMFLSQQGATSVKHPISGINTDLKIIAFDTGHCLVDFTGGPKKPAAKGQTEYAEPAQILLLDPDGRLIIRHEAEDRAAYERQTPQAAAAPKEPGKE